ncbi:MAG: hypothetical protein AABW91_01155 [Nanoarchaeota archaeon]
MGFKGLSNSGYLLLFILSFVFILSMLNFVSAQNSCTNDLQCGFTGFFGSEFCKSNDVYKNYQTALCNSNICSVVVEEKLVNDCNDGDNSTLDSCLEENNLAYCKHDLVQCSENDECGSPTEHFFCQSGDVWHQVNNPVCDINSTQCIFESYEELYENCEVGCNNAHCIPKVQCNSNLDCSNSSVSSNYCFSDNVVRDVTNYTCVYPGSAVSFCQQNTQKETVQSCTNSCLNAQCTSNGNNGGDNNVKHRGGIRDFEDLNPLFFTKTSEVQPVTGIIIPPNDINETVSKVTKKASYSNFWILFWLLLLLVLIIIILILIVIFRRR